MDLQGSILKGLQVNTMSPLSISGTRCGLYLCVLLYLPISSVHRGVGLLDIGLRGLSQQCWVSLARRNRNCTRYRLEQRGLLSALAAKRIANPRGEAGFQKSQSTPHTPPPPRHPSSPQLYSAGRRMNVTHCPQPAVGHSPSAHRLCLRPSSTLWRPDTVHHPVLCHTPCYLDSLFVVG